jgi:cyclo(L-tyrosyl-L-tyrosyl) synthase
MSIQKIYSYIEADKTVSLYVKKIDEPISTCEIFQEKKMMLVGISMGNSYFNDDRLRVILSGFSLAFEKVAVLLVDDLAVHNYRAMGYEEKKILHKISSHSRHLTNKIKKNIHEVEEKYHKNNIIFYQWKDIEVFPQYHKSVDVITEYYNNNNEFADEINQVTLKVMDSYISDAQDGSFVLDEAKWYLLKELAFIHCASDFFGSSLVTGYYIDFPLYRNLLSSNIMNEPNKHVFISYEYKEEF